MGESRTRIMDQRTGKKEDYIQCASCKSEDTFAKQDLFYQDNYDFLPIFGPQFGLIFRRKAWLNPDYRTYQKTEDMWGGQVYNLIECDSPKELDTCEDVLQATHKCCPIVAQTEIENGKTGLRGIIEYPVKTMNTRRADNAYQVDTGPVVLPTLGQRTERLINTLSLAFVVFNTPEFADFVVEESTSARAPGATDGVQVYHYSRRISLPAANRLYSVT